MSWCSTGVALNATLQPEVTCLCHQETVGVVVVCTALDLFSQEFSSKSLKPDEGCLAMVVVAVVPFVQFGVKKQFDPCYNSLSRVGVIYYVLAVHVSWNANRAQAPFQ